MDMDAESFAVVRDRLAVLEARVAEIGRALERYPRATGDAGWPAAVAAPAADRLPPVAPVGAADARRPAVAPALTTLLAAGLAPAPAAELAAPARPMAPAAPPPPRVAAWRRLAADFDLVGSAEYGLTLLGMVLFLCGIAFLYKYGLDEHWLSAPDRIGTGLGLGMLLLVAGFGLQRRRPRFGHVLLGGSIASYYITGYAAYQVFPELQLPYTLACGLMAGVTLLAFVLAVWQNAQPLAFIGLAGGLLTPFVLGRPEAHLPAVVAYTCLLGLGASAIYLACGWRPLLWHALNGVWTVLLFDYVARFLSSDAILIADRWALQGGAAFVLFSFWLVPVWREVRCALQPARRCDPAPLPAWAAALRGPLAAHVLVLTAVLPLAVFAFSAAIWADLLDKQIWGLIALGGAALCILICAAIRRAVPRLAYTHALVAVALLTLSLLLLLEGNLLLLALAVEGAGLLLLGARRADLGLTIGGHLLFAGAGVWLALRLVPGDSSGPALVNPGALTDLAVMGLALLVAACATPRAGAVVYRSAFHLALLALIWREMHGLPNGDSLVMLAWAGYGLLLHVWARRLVARVDALSTSVAAHCAFDAALGMLAMHLVMPYAGVLPIWNARAGFDLLMMGLALAASSAVPGGRAATLYRLAVHCAVLAWLGREASAVEQGHGYVMLRWAAYLTAVAVLARRLADRRTLLFLNLPYVGVGLLLAGRLLQETAGHPPIFNGAALLDALVLVLALPLAVVAMPPGARMAYRLAVHGGVLGLLWRELHGLPQGVDLVLLAWAAYGVLLLLLGLRARDLTTQLAGHAVFALSGLLLLARITLGLILVNPYTLAVFNVKGLSDLGIVVLGALAGRLVPAPRARLAYGAWLYLAFGGWVWQEVGLLPSGNGYVTLAWGLGALGLLLAGWARPAGRPLLLAGIATLLAVAAKLFLIDLRYLAAIWPILLFLGFGGLFLLLSYYLQRLSRVQSG